MIKRTTLLTKHLKTQSDKGWKAIVKQWQTYKTWVKKNELVALDRRYLPAVIELQESPPSPTIRILLIGICTLVFLSIVWATFGRIDIVAVGQGKIVPSGRVKVIQPVETASISKIFVEEGQAVRKGQPLVELDLTLTEADRDRAQGELQNAEADVARITALLNGKKPKFQNNIPEEVRLNQQSFYEQAKGEQESTLASLNQQLLQKQHEQAGIKSNVTKLQKTIPLISERTASYKKLSEKRYVARSQYLNLEEQRVGQIYELEAQKQHLHELAAEIQGVREQINTQTANFRRTQLTILNEATQKRMSLTQELAKAEQRNKLQHLVAPIDGSVQELRVHTVGGVVTPAQELMKVIPFEDAMEAEIFIQNKDIGFVQEGQPVRIKLEAYPFTKYGLVEGKVKKLSLDAINDEKQGLIYSLRVSIDVATLRVGDKDILLTPGLAVTGEIKTGSRRIIEYFLSPIMQHTSEAIHER